VCQRGQRRDQPFRQDIDPKSPIFGLPALDVEKATTALFIKRARVPAARGIENGPCLRNNMLTLFGAAREKTNLIVNALAH
jgi:NAD(P) transhydrogenase subunit beta